MALALLGGAYPLPAAANGYTDYVVARELEKRSGQNNNRWIDVPGRGLMIFYAQTNPFWAEMRYEVEGSGSFRHFGEGGCCPTSAAIAFANLLPVTDLGKIRPYASIRASGYGISTGVMNPLNMTNRIGVQWLEYAEDYQRYLPLVFGQFAAGNNRKRDSWRAKPRKRDVSTGGTGVGFVPVLCEIYGLNYIQAPGRMNMDWLVPVQNGAVAIALANSQWQPFAKSAGHYVVIVACDDDYLYLFDPQDKPQDQYDRDRKKVLEVLENGLLRVKMENFRYLQIGNIYVITNAEVEAKLAKLPKPTETPASPQ